MAPEDVAVAFFSYCREDSEFALKLAEDLKVAGAHVWIDQLDIEPGTPWDRAVEDALTNSPRMLVILSPVSVNSDNVRDEVSFALSRQKRVIPVLYRDCDVPFRLARLQHIDFRPDYARALKILLRALGVGEAAHSHLSSGAVAVAAAEITVAITETEESARQQQLEAERQLADEQAQLEEARKYAIEQARLKKEREAAAERAAQEHAQRTESEARASQEQSRREQRAAEQARLEEEARLAAERMRLAQQEKERREAEIKARQAQLRREEQESIERKSLILDAERPAERESDKRQPQPEKIRPGAAPVPPAAAQRRAQESVHAEATPSVAPEHAVPRPRPALGTGVSLTSPKYLAGGAALIVVLGLIIFLVAHRSGPEKPADSKAAENKAAESSSVQQAQPPRSADKAPESASSSQPGQSPAIPATAPNQSQGNDKTKPAAPDKDLGKAKNPAQSPVEVSNPNPADGSTLNAANAANVSKSANAASPSTRVRVSQGVSQGMLMYQVAPTYPPLARSANVHGQVVLDVVIGKDGTVQSIKTESGHPWLVPAAIDAVKKWRYKPYKLDGKAIDFDTQVIVNFTLTN